MTYPARQWDADQQDAIARVQALRALREIRNDAFKNDQRLCNTHGIYHSVEMKDLDCDFGDDA